MKGILIMAVETERTTQKTEPGGPPVAMRRVTVPIIDGLLSRYQGMATAIPPSTGESTDQVVAAGINAGLACYYASFEHDSDDASDCWLSSFEEAKQEYGRPADRPPVPLDLTGESTAPPDRPARRPTPADTGSGPGESDEGPLFQMVPIHGRLYRELRSYCEAHAGGPHGRESADWLVRAVVNGTVAAEIEALRDGGVSLADCVAAWRKIAGPVADTPPASAAAPADTAASVAGRDTPFVLPELQRRLVRLAGYLADERRGWTAADLAQSMLNTAVDVYLQSMSEAERPDDWTVTHWSEVQRKYVACEARSQKKAPAAGKSGPEPKAKKASVVSREGSSRGRGKQRRRSHGGAALAAAR